MPDNRSRKRKQPASPSPTNPRPPPYSPHDGNRQNHNNNSNRGGGGRPNNHNRRQNSSGGPGSPHNQQQQHTSQQNRAPQQNRPHPPPPNRAPSRLSMSTPAPTPATPAAADTPMEDATKPETPTDAKPIPYFHWDYITDDVSKDWTGTGSRSIASRLVELAADKDNEPEISIIFQELIKSALEGRLSPFMVSRFLIECFETAEPIAAASGLDLKRIFIQTVSIFEVNESKDETPDSLIKLLQGLHPRIFSHEYYGLNLETSTLIGLGLVTNQFSKKSVRVTTAMVYKQRKHNLLREETEGFSKLITEFFTASYSSQPLEVVGRTDERVKGLIGAFELDPGRVLDILLDTAACTVVSNARFFVRLLKCSAWWPQQLQHLIEDDTPKSKEEKEREKEEKEAEKERQDREFFDKLGREGISAFFETLEKGTGNKVAAQLLGFKFRYYQRKDVTETTPENLLVLSALLIKIGFIDLADLYPHLAPHDDEGMTEVLNAWRAKLDEKQRGGKRNALMMAGALVDDTAPPTRNNVRSTVEEKKPEEKKPEAPPEKKEDNQKLFLLKYLLAVGALPEAMFILGKYPWLPGPSDDITEHLARVITQSLDGVYPAHRPPNIPMGSKKVSTALQSSRVAGGIEQFEQPRRKPMVTFTVSNLRLKTGDVEYRFFWEEWKEGVPICREPQHVVVLMETLGRVLGVRIGRDPGVITRVCRIGKDQLTDPNCTEEERSSWIGLARSLLIPAISLTEGNQGIVNEVWKLLECFSTKERYSLYGEWTSVTSKRIPELKNKVAETERETRDLLKRISKTNVKQMARQLAKVATSNPVTVMQVVLGQVEGYDNLIECVVDAARYFTPLGFDAVGFCVLNSMSNENKRRVQADGMLTSKWLQSLAVFCGKIYTRYHAQMNPAPVLEYVARQLKRNRSVELIVLQQLMQSMAGVNPETNLNDAQLQALAGGEMLRKQTLKAFRDKRAEDTDETMRTLTKTLANENLAAQLLILIAQERQTSIFRIEESSAPLKVLANLFDEIHVVLSQYLDLMKLCFTPERFEQVVPSVGDLVQKYGIEPSVAWWIYRLGLKSRMSRSATETEDVEMKDIPAEPITDATPVAKSPCHPVLEKMVDEIKPILPEAVWTKLSISFYITFWQLEIHDIFVPIEAYGAEQKRIMSAVEINKNDRSDMSIAGQERRKIRGQQLQNDLDLLNAEVKNHMKHHQAIRRRLTAEKDMWFRDDRFNQREITDAVIQHCLFPRVMISPNDASFCSRFIREVHRMGTPKFHTIGVYDAIFGRGLSTVIFICTQREAENYGRFLKEILQDLHSWHADRNVYEKEAYGTNKGLVGFFVKGQPFDYEDFRKILYKWHKTLHTAVKNCLSSKEYMHIRNAIVVLKHVVDYFPAVDWIGRTVVEKVEDLVKSEKREDLKIAAMTLLGMLKKKEKDWMIVAAFQKSEAVAPGMMKPSPTPLPDNGKPSSPVPPQPQQQINQQPQQQPQQPPPPPQPQQTSRPPSALAKEFRPMATSEPNHNQNAAPPQQQARPQPPPTPALPSKPPGGEKEDGEVDDRRNRIQPPASLPQRPQQPLPDHRKPMTPVREPPQHQPQHQPPQQQHPNSRVPTPRREEPRPQQQDMRRAEPQRTPSGRQLVPPHPQHQLPERPEVPRQATLERRDSVRDSRPPQQRLPEKPVEQQPGRRGHSPPRHERRGPPEFRPREQLRPEPIPRHPAEEIRPHPPPQGPRGFDRRGSDRKDLFTPPAPPPQRQPPSGPAYQQDPNHGRLNPPENHGRLNPPEPVIPKGPRDRTAPPFARRTPQQPQPVAPGPPVNSREMPPPPQQQQGEGAQPELAGIHPDRLKAMGAQPAPASPPTGPARSDEARNQRRRILNVQSHLTGEERRAGRRSAATTPTTANPPMLARSASAVDIRQAAMEQRTGGESQREREREREMDRTPHAPRDRGEVLPTPREDRTSQRDIVTPREERASQREMVTPRDDRGSARELVTPREERPAQDEGHSSSSGRGGRHHREHRSDRERRGESDRRAAEAERERERERGGRERRSERSSRGEGRERESRGEPREARGEPREGREGREREGREERRGEERRERGESGRKREHPHTGREEKREGEVKRRRRGGEGGGGAW